MKVAYVVPRYGEQVLGGAESVIRMLAERLARDRRWEVEVFTTCAVDISRWEDVLSPGTTTERGVVVHRFQSKSGRTRWFAPYSAFVLSRRAPSHAQQVKWLMTQGPVCPDALAAAEASTADLVAFSPYGYYPTVVGVPRLGRRAVMHPAAHDEPALRLPIMKEAFETAGAFVFLTDAERELAEAEFALGRAPRLVLGSGIDVQPGIAERGRAALGLEAGVPYVVCLGRVDPLKGSALLAQHFRSYKRRHPGPLKLVFVGPVDHRPRQLPRRDVLFPGVVDDQTKWDVLAGAEALVQPSPNESFSLALVEGWAAGLPAIVNARCRPTSDLCAASGGGLSFSTEAEFESALARVLGDGAFRAGAGAAGRAFVEANYDWSVVLDRYTRFLEEVVNER